MTQASMVRIELPWPDRALHPNARPHWAVKGRATKSARIGAAWAAKLSGAPKLPEGASVRVTPIITPPNNRGHDTDGVVASCKAAYDGIADWIGIDDRNWSHGAPVRLPAKAPARVVGEIEAVTNG